MGRFGVVKIQEIFSLISSVLLPQPRPHLTGIPLRSTVSENLHYRHASPQSVTFSISSVISFCL